MLIIRKEIIILIFILFTNISLGKEKVLLLEEMNVETERLNEKISFVLNNPHSFILKYKPNNTSIIRIDKRLSYIIYCF